MASKQINAWTKLSRHLSKKCLIDYFMNVKCSNEPNICLIYCRITQTNRFQTNFRDNFGNFWLFFQKCMAPSILHWTKLRRQLVGRIHIRQKSIDKRKLGVELGAQDCKDSNWCIRSAPSNRSVADGDGQSFLSFFLIVIFNTCEYFWNHEWYWSIVSGVWKLKSRPTKRKNNQSKISSTLTGTAINVWQLLSKYHHLFDIWGYGF